YNNIITKILYMLAGIAPSATGIILVCINNDKDYRKDFWKRILNFKLISVKWYLIIFIVIPITSCIAILINYLFTSSFPDFKSLENLIKNPFSILTFALYMLLFGPIAEEIGWRGYALDYLEKKFNWVSSSLILGFFWAFWHLPMFFIKGTYQYDLMNKSFLLFIDFYIAIFAVSIIMDWVYNNSKRSILSGILIHFCINFFGEIFDLPDNIMYLRTLVQVILAVFILIYYKIKYFLKLKVNEN
ncbi:MAG: Abortive infection protein, partial [Clostridia bacterium]|nr:Abortive infection protein [Clostridia bacterium]